MPTTTTTTTTIEDDGSSNTDSHQQQQQHQHFPALYCNAVVNHLIWSTQTVASRYLQVYAEPTKFDGQGVLATSKLTSAILLFACSAQQSGSCGSTCFPFIASSSNDDDEDKEGKEKEEVPTYCSSNRDDNEQNGTNTTSTTQQEGFDDAITTNAARKTKGWNRQKYLFALLFGLVCTMRAALNIASTKFTLSYYITAINSLTPIFTSIGDSILLKAKLPKALWPCVVVSCIGCTMIGFSQSLVGTTTSSSSPLSFTKQDAIGCALQFASMCFSSAARLLMKGTEGILSKNEAVQTNNICNCVFPLLYTLAFNPGGWVAFRDMTLASFAAWCVVSILVYTIGSVGQINLVRTMGPGMYSSLGGIRVLASALLSAVWLNEPVDNWLEWLGLLLLVCTMTAYTLSSIGVCTLERRSDSGSSEEGDIDMKALISPAILGETELAGIHATVQENTSVGVDSGNKLDGGRLT